MDGGRQTTWDDVRIVPGIQKSKEKFRRALDEAHEQCMCDVYNQKDIDEAAKMDTQGNAKLLEYTPRSMMKKEQPIRILKE